MDFARLNEHRIAYWHTGSGIPVVLVHGSFATSSAWKRLAANLDASAWHAVAPDLPGWGESDPVPEHPALVDLEAAAVEAVAKQVSDGPIHLAGHSHGGTVALAVALAGRVPVQSLTLFEPLPVSLLERTGDRAEFNEVTDFVSGYRRAFEAGEKWAARAVIDLWGGPGAFEAMSPAVREFIAVRTEQNLRDWQGSFAFRPPLEELQRLRVPTTIVHGALSNRIAKLIALRLNQSIPNSTAVEMSGASHFMIHTHAAESARLIRQAEAVQDNTAVRVALWRALHLEVDSPPHVFEDEVGLKLAAPDDGWRSRPDMSPFTRPFRASIVGRARFIEDLVAEQAARGVGQYVILGAGLDTFAQRRSELAARLRVFEIDRPGPQAWKRQRLVDLGLGVPSFLRLVPVDFEAGDPWWERLVASGFDSGRAAVVASTGVSMYLTRDAIVTTLRQVAAFAPGSTFAMSFMLPIELADPEVRPGIERAAAGARANGTPFISFFTPAEMLTLARDAGFKAVQHVSAAMLAQRYFAGRQDGLRPPNNSEELLVATT